MTNDNLYAELGRNVQEVLVTSEETFDKGRLGYAENRVYSIFEGPAHMRVVLDSGTFIKARHYGRVPATPSYPVLVGWNPSTSEHYIKGEDPDRIVSFFNSHPSSASSVGYHSHHFGSGMEFPIDPRLFTPLNAVPLGGKTLKITGGFYYHDNLIYFKEEQNITLAPYTPVPITYKCWVVVGLNLTLPGHDVIIVKGEDVPGAMPISEADIVNIPFIENGYLPLFAVKLYQNREMVTASDIYPLYNLNSISARKGDRLDFVLTAEGQPIVYQGVFVSYGN